MTQENDYEVGYGKPPKDKQWKPGQSGNPSGKPAGTNNLVERLKKRLIEHPEDVDKIIDTLINLALGKQKKLSAIREIKEWIDGKSGPIG